MNHYRITGWVEGPGGTVPFRRVFTVNDEAEAVHNAAELAQALWDGELTITGVEAISISEAEQERARA